MTDDKILSQIAAAMLLAEKASTEEEADNAMKVAQRLASKYSIDLAVARAHTAKSAKRTTPTHRRIVIGEARKKGLRTYVSLFMAIGKANDVTFNIAHNSTYVIAFGFSEDIDLTEALYASLIVQMVRASDAYLRAGTYKEETTYRKVTKRDSWGFKYSDWDHAPVSGSMARINFQEAFASRVGARLEVAQREAREEAVAAERAVNEDAARRMDTGVDQDAQRAEYETTGTELAIVEKATEIKDYYKQHSDARGNWRGFRAATTISYDARTAGSSAGDSARLGTEKAIGGMRRGIAS